MLIACTYCIHTQKKDSAAEEQKAWLKKWDHGDQKNTRENYINNGCIHWMLPCSWCVCEVRAWGLCVRVFCRGKQTQAVIKSPLPLAIPTVSPTRLPPHKKTATHLAETQRWYTTPHTYRPRSWCFPGGPTWRRRRGSRRPGSSRPGWHARSCGCGCGTRRGDPGPRRLETPPPRTWSHTPTRTDGSACLPAEGRETHCCSISYFKLTVYMLSCLKTRGMSFCPVLQHCIPPLSETLCFSACLFKALPPEYPVSSNWSAHTCLSQHH